MTIADEINRMVRSILEASTWTSAGGDAPRENFIKEVRGIETPDLEKVLSEGTDDTTKEASKTTDAVKKAKRS